MGDGKGEVSCSLIRKIAKSLNHQITEGLDSK
jgi:hypothetical protein